MIMNCLMIAKLYLVMLLPIQGIAGFVLAYSIGPSVTYHDSEIDVKVLDPQNKRSC